MTDPVTATSGARSGFGGDEDERAGVARLVAAVSVAGVPAAVGKIVSEAAQPGAGHGVGDELPPRLGGADGRVEQRFRSPVVGLEEAVGAVYSTSREFV